MSIDKPRLFDSSFKRGVDRPSRTKETSLGQLEGTNMESTASFKYDTYGKGIKSTQQIPINWEKFENHTFFNSAEGKVNVAFDRIINNFPFDGTKKEYESFMDSLTGFEKHVYDKFPKNTGFLMFSGSSKAALAQGTYIQVLDMPGAAYPVLANPSDGKSILNPENKSFTIDLRLFPALQANENQIICQRLGSDRVDHGMLLALSKSASSKKCDIVFSVASGSQRASVTYGIEKGKFNHICATFDRRYGSNKLKLYVSESLVATSSMTLSAGTLDFDTGKFMIGSGSAQVITNGAITSAYQFVPKQTLTGAIDEFRFYHRHIGTDEQKRNARKAVFSEEDLQLYFKFNEPYGDIGINKIILDSSGNSLHTDIENFSDSLRLTASIDTPLLYEDASASPVLFPKYSSVSKLNTELLASASSYDNKNPNLITKLIPPHYLVEGRDFQGFKTVDGQLSDSFSGGNTPRSGRMGSVQLITSLLFVWAKHFDELKMFLDHVSTLTYLDYDEEGDVVDNFLPFVAQFYGVDLPNFFRNASMEQFVGGENIQNPRSGDYNKSKQSLRYVQSQIWRRVLANVPDYVTSKGTLHSIKSIIRATGIEPDGIFRIREFGGPVSKAIGGLRQSRTEVSTLVDLSGSIRVPHNAIDSQGFSSNIPYLISPFLSASRIEVGYPPPAEFKLATGTIRVIDYGQVDEGDKLWLTDSNGKKVLFEFDASGSLSSTATMIKLGNWGLGDRDDQLAKRITSAITSSFSGSITGSVYQHTASFIQGIKNRATLGNYSIGTNASGLSALGFANGQGFILQNRDGYGIHGVSPRESDGLFTSGSWTYEAHYCFPERQKYATTQSIARLHTTGTESPSPFLHTNLLVMSGGKESVALYTRTCTGSYTLDQGFHKLILTGCNIFDGEKWYISFGRKRGDKFDPKLTPSSSYFLRAARQSFGEIKEIYQTSSIYHEKKGSDGTDVLQSKNTKYNASGTFIIIGSQSLNNEAVFLNDATNVTAEGRITDFGGQVGHIRFWSKYLDNTEWKEHVLNYKSLGVSDPKTNFNFTKHRTGAFERLRLDVSTDQIVTKSDDSGNITLHDFSQNNFHISGYGFEKNKERVIRPTTFYYSFLSPQFDSQQTSEKIRVRGFQNADNFDKDGISTMSPVNFIPPDQEANDDVRFSVDFSVVDTLDEDIVNMFSSLDFFDNAIGDPNLIFSDNYPALEGMQDVYFNRLTEKIDVKSFFEFFKWFDSVFEDLIAQMLPRKTSFMGVNFVIESHLLERHKMKYGFDQMWLLSKERDNDKGNLFLAQVVGTVKRF